MGLSQSIYIGIDLGTSGVRACAINSLNECLHMCATPLPEPEIQGQSISQTAELWWQATQTVLIKLLGQINTGQIRAISVNGTSGTVLVCDQQGTPLAPARMYNDAFCTEQANFIETVAPAQSAAHGPSSGLAKLLYLQKQQPDAKYFLHQADWIVGQLSGKWGISDENNALKTGYDPLNATWPDWLSALSVNLTLLPKVVPPGTPIGRIKAGLLPGIAINPACQIISGTTDSIAAFIATGAHKPGDAVTSLGSTLVLKVISEKPISSPEFGIYSHKLGKFWLAGGASNSGGAVLKKYFTTPQINSLSASINPDKLIGLDYYPLLKAGERFPICDPLLAPKLDPKAKTDEAFFQAILEGISKIEQQGYEKLRQLGAPYPTQVETAGGGSVNKHWTKIREGFLNVAVKQAANNEACYGSALLAKQGIESDR